MHWPACHVIKIDDELIVLGFILGSKMSPPEAAVGLVFHRIYGHRDFLHYRHDTGVGKTVLTALLLSSLRARGRVPWR